MASLTIQVTRSDKLAQFDAIFVEAAIPRLTVLGEQGVAIVQQNASVDRGTFRNSIATKVETPSPSIVGMSIFSQANPVVVNVIEYGRAPGTFAPIDAILGWVARKLRPAPNMLRSIAYRVNLKIFRRGIPGKHIFRNALNQMRPQIQKTADEIGSEIAKRL